MDFFINIFALHYFLWFAALTSIYGYFSVYAEHYANASSSQYGFLNMVLPFVTILAKLFFCSLADRHRAYRSFFTWFLITSLAGFGSFGVLPFFINPQPKNSGLNYGTWAIVCIMTTVSTISMGVISCLSDAFAMNSSKKNNSSYGFIRVWGTIGWGVSSLLLAFINQTDKLPLLVPGLIMTILLLTVDIFMVVFWPAQEDFKLDKSNSNIDIKDIVSVLSKNSIDLNLEGDRLRDSKAGANIYGTNDVQTVDPVRTEIGQPRSRDIEEISDLKLQWLLFKAVALRRKSLFRYLILFTISGALMSVQWSYFFLYLKNIYEADFTFISGLSMVGQSMIGELPFFILSKFVIQHLGRSHTLSLSIITIGLRYFLYRYLLPNSSMYFVLLTEAFQGPNFGLFYVVMTEVGLDYSDCEEAIVDIVGRGIVANDPPQIQKLRQALRATMQSLTSACYEGLGVGIGSIIGGVIIDIYGFDRLWIWAGATAIILGLANLFIELSSLPIFVDKSSSLEV